MDVEVSNESGMAVDEFLIVDAARFALARMDVHPGAELAATLVDLDVMEELHIQWMDLPGPTDVLSFPMDELKPGGRPDVAEPGAAMLGDLVICPQFAAEQAVKAGHSLEHELAVLTVHGILHLLGYDHAEPAEEHEMFSLQNRLLAEWYDDMERRAAQDESGELP